LIEVEGIWSAENGDYAYRAAAIGHWLALWHQMEALSGANPGHGLHELQFDVAKHLTYAADFQDRVFKLWRSSTFRPVCVGWSISLRPLLGVFDKLVRQPGGLD
jgi:hypothetical protein